MSRTITLSGLRTAIATQGDFTISASGRYSTTSVNFYINSSVQRFRERITNQAMTHYLVSTTGTVTSGATSPYSFKSLDLSAVSPAIVRVYGVDLTVSGIVKTLAHRPFEERNDYGAPTITGEPMAWAMYQTTTIALMPAPNQSYSYTVWYLPKLADMSDDADTFDGVAGWEQWIIWDCVCQLIARDTYQSAYNQAVQLRNEVWQDIIRSSTKVTSAGGAIVGRDTLRAGGFGRRAFSGPVAAGGYGLPPDGSVTNAMLASAPEATLKGRARGAGAGSPTDLRPEQAAANVAVFSGYAAGLVPTGSGNPLLFLTQAATWDTPSVGGSVSGLALSQIQNIAPDRVLGRSTAGTGAVEQLRGQQVASMIGVFTGSAHGLVPYPSGGFDSTLFLAGDSTWRTPAGGVSSGIGNNQLLPFPPLSVLGNPASASGTTDYLSQGQVASMLPLFGTASGATRGLVYSPTAGVAGRFLSDDGVFRGVPSLIPTGITLGQFAPIPETTILGRTSPSGIPEALTPSAVATMMPVFNSIDKGLVPPGSAGDSTKFLAGDQTWRTPPGGGGGANNPGLPTMSVQFNLGSGVFGGATGFLFSPSGFGLQLSHNLRMPTGTILLGATGAESAPVGWIGAYSGAINFGIGTGLLGPAFTIETPPDAAGTVRFRTWDMGGAGSPRTLFSTNRNIASGNINLTVGSNDLSALSLHSRHQTLLRGAGPTGFIQGALGTNITEAFAARPGHHTWSVSGAQKLGLDNDGLSVWGQLGVQRLAHSAATDKLASWTASGFGNVATGITIGASGYSLSVGSGGPVLHGSGADFRSSNIENVKRLNGLDGIKIYGFVSGGGAASGSENILAASGTAFIIPETVTAGQVFNFVSSGAATGDLVMLENRSGITHRANNVGTPSAFMSTVVPSGGTSFRFASGTWAIANHVQFG